MKNTKTKATKTQLDVNVAENEVSVSDRLKQALSHIPEVTQTKTQQQELTRELKRQLGVLRRGRPVDMSSVRQERLAELESKREKGELKLGRPKYTEDQRVKADAEKAKRAEEEAKHIRQIAEQIIAAKL